MGNNDNKWCAVFCDQCGNTEQLLHYWDCWRRQCTIELISILWNNFHNTFSTRTRMLYLWYSLTKRFSGAACTIYQFGLILKRQFTDNVPLLVFLIVRYAHHYKANFLVWTTIPWSRRTNLDLILIGHKHNVQVSLSFKRYLVILDRKICLYEMYAIVCGRVKNITCSDKP